MMVSVCPICPTSPDEARGATPIVAVTISSDRTTGSESGRVAHARKKPQRRERSERRHSAAEAYTLLQAGPGSPGAERGPPDDRRFSCCPRRKPSRPSKHRASSRAATCRPSGREACCKRRRISLDGVLKRDVAAYWTSGQVSRSVPRVTVVCSGIDDRHDVGEKLGPGATDHDVSAGIAARKGKVNDRRRRRGVGLDRLGSPRVLWPQPPRA